MRLARILAKNYRTLEDINLSFSPDYCAISGKNNAGKSCIIQLISCLFIRPSRRPWIQDDFSIEYREDLTQWVKNDPPIEISYQLCLNKKDDPSLIEFIKKQASIDINDDEFLMNLNLKLALDQALETTVEISGELVGGQDATEIHRKLQDSDSLFLHNSTNQDEDIYYSRGRGRAVYEIHLSTKEQKSIQESEQTVERKVKKLAKEHRNELSEMLGKLASKYDVEFTMLERGTTRMMPLGINLKDKNVEVPLCDWGSGTQNQTRILMSVLQANRIKNQPSVDDKITPIVIIEEPESFLHPSAQAEFGRILQSLSGELGIQIISSTHSPYMLNQINPSANILLQRRVERKKLKETQIADTSEANWMAPFAEHLGIVPPEFESWRGLFGPHKSWVLLVEGETDKLYFEHLREKYPEYFQVPIEIEIVPYGGKDALKNTMLVKFVLGQFDGIFITYDLDADMEVARYLENLGLVKKRNFVAVGLDKPGRQAIEGLLPDRVISAVNGQETDLIMQLSSKETKERNKAKRSLKKKYLDEFKAQDGYTKEELNEFTKVGRTIAKAFISR